MTVKTLAALAAASLLAGCAQWPGNDKPTDVITEPSKPSGRYSVEHDFGPDQRVDVSHVGNAVPRVEPRSRIGNSASYQVFGKTYYVLPSANGYQETGGASWYGKKFHGHETSNGDIYDMYAMSAAHKSLPLPTYVKVRNLANQREVIVRVNDRGPFHEGRIIDLSYAAAAKLGMLDRGTAEVEVTAIDPVAWQAQQGDSQQAAAVAAVKPAVQLAANSAAPADAVVGRYLQAGAYGSETSARAAVAKLAGLNVPAKVASVQREDRTLYRVLLGPEVEMAKLEALIEPLAQLGFPGAHLVNWPANSPK